MTWQMATSLYLLAAAHCSQRTVAQPECRLPENESDTNDMDGADGGRRRKGDELVGLRLRVDLDAWRSIHVIMTPSSTPGWLSNTNVAVHYRLPIAMLSVFRLESRSELARSTQQEPGKY